jgi:hypothetical protein
VLAPTVPGLTSCSRSSTLSEPHDPDPNPDPNPDPDLVPAAHRVPAATQKNIVNEPTAAFPTPTTPSRAALCVAVTYLPRVQRALGALLATSNNYHLRALVAALSARPPAACNDMNNDISSGKALETEAKVDAGESSDGAETGVGQSAADRERALLTALACVIDAEVDRCATCNVETRAAQAGSGGSRRSGPDFSGGTDPCFERFIRDPTGLRIGAGVGVGETLEDGDSATFTCPQAPISPTGRALLRESPYAGEPLAEPMLVNHERSPASRTFPVSLPGGSGPSLPGALLADSQSFLTLHTKQERREEDVIIISSNEADSMGSYWREHSPGAQKLAPAASGGGPVCGGPADERAKSFDDSCGGADPLVPADPEVSGHPGAVKAGGQALQSPSRKRKHHECDGVCFFM